MPNEVDASGEVQLVMVGKEFWLRFFRVKVLNNPVKDTLFVYFYKHKQPARSLSLGNGSVLVRLSGTSHGGLEDAMPDEIQMPLENVRTKRGHVIDHAAFQSLIIVRPGIRMDDGTSIPTITHAFCEFQEVAAPNLAFNKKVQAAVGEVQSLMKDVESGAGMPASLRGKSYEGMESIAKDAFSTLGKGKGDTLDFEEFKVLLSSLRVKHTEPRAYKWFVLGDIDRSGAVDEGELAFILSVISRTKPSRLLRPRDVFLMFDVDSKSASHADQLGTVDLIGFYEIVKAFNPSASQDSIESAFKAADPSRKHRISYPPFLRAWATLVRPRSELERRGMKASAVVGSSLAEAGSETADDAALGALQRALVQVIEEEDREEDEDLEQAIRFAHRARQRTRGVRERKKRAVWKDAAQSDKRKRRQRALQERQRRMDERRAAEEQAKRAQEEARLHEAAQAAKAERERKEAEAVRQAAAEREEQEAKRRQDLALDRMLMSGKGLQYLPSTLWRDPKASALLPHLVIMDVSDNELVCLPAGHLFTRTSSLRKLDVSRNRLARLPDDVQACHELLILLATDNQLDTLPAELAGLHQLRRLDLRGNLLRSLPSSLGQIASLEALNVSVNPLEDVSLDALLPMRKLQELNLSGCSLEFMPNDAFLNMSALTKLDVSGNKLREIPPSLARCSALRHLRLQSNSLRCLPTDIGQCHRLSSIDASSNALRELPVDLSGLYYLLDLNLAQNRIVELPSSVGELTSLQRLNVGSNRLVSLPAPIGYLSDVQLMDMSKNALTSIPETIGGLKRLRHWDLSHNSLGSGGTECLPQAVASLMSLEWLDVSHNSISRLAPQVAGLTSLRHANLSHNSLAALPPQLCVLSSLCTLDASHNRLRQLPVEIGFLTELVAIDLSCNILTQLPDTIGKLSKVRHFHVYNNLLERLPMTLVPLFANLLTFDCARNPLRDLPDKLSAQDAPGARALSLRFSRKPQAAHDILLDIQAGMDREASRAIEAERQVEQDAKARDRDLMLLHDERAQQWRRQRVNVRLLNWGSRPLWQPVDSLPGMTKQHVFSGGREPEPDAATLSGGIDAWWEARAAAEKAIRLREKSKREAERRRVRQSQERLPFTSDLLDKGALSAVERTRQRVLRTLGESTTSEAPSAPLRADQEREWRLCDKSLEWTDDDELWARRMYERELLQEREADEVASAAQEAAQAAQRTEFWESKGFRADELAPGAVPSQRQQTKARDGGAHRISAARATEPREAAERHVPPTADLPATAEEADSESPGAVSCEPDAAHKSAEDLQHGATGQGARQEAQEEHPAPPATEALNMSSVPQTWEEGQSSPSPLTPMPLAADLGEGDRVRLRGAPGSTGRSPTRPQQHLTRPPSRKTTVRRLKDEIRQLEASVLERRRQDKEALRALKSKHAREVAAEESLLAAEDALVQELQAGPPVPVNHAIRRSRAGGGSRGRSIDPIMMPHHRGSRLHAISQGKARPGSRELSIRYAAIAGRRPASIMGVGAVRTRFNYANTPMYQGLKNPVTALQAATAGAITPGGVINNLLVGSMAPHKGMSRFNLSAYDTFADSPSKNKRLLVSDVLKDPQVRSMGIPRFNADDYEHYKSSLASNASLPERALSGMEPETLPSTVTRLQAGAAPGTVSRVSAKEEHERQTLLAKREAEARQAAQARLPSQPEAERPTSRAGNRIVDAAGNVVEVVGASSGAMKAGARRRGTRVKDLPRQRRVQRYNMTTSMVKVGLSGQVERVSAASRQAGGRMPLPTAPTSDVEADELRLARLKQMVEGLESDEDDTASDSDGGEAEREWTALFGRRRTKGEQRVDDTDTLLELISIMKQDKSLEIPTRELDAVSRLLSASRQGLRDDGLVEDIQVRAWQEAGYDVPSKVRQRREKQARQLLLQLKVAALHRGRTDFKALRAAMLSQSEADRVATAEGAARKKEDAAKRARHFGALQMHSLQHQGDMIKATIADDTLSLLGLEQEQLAARVETLEPRDDAWEPQHSELRAPSAASMAHVTGEGLWPKFGEGLTEGLWSSDPYAPRQGVGSEAAAKHAASVLVSPDKLAGEATVQSETDYERELMHDRIGGQQRLDPSRHVPAATLTAPARSRANRSAARQWSTAGQHGDHSIRPRAQEHANSAAVSKGYTPADVAEYLSVQSVVYPHCMAEWVTHGGEYMDRVRGLRDFESAVRRRLGSSWDSQLTAVVRRFFVETRDNGGVAPAFEVVTPDMRAARAARSEHHATLKELQHQRVTARLDALQKKQEEKYAVSPSLLRQRMVAQQARAKQLAVLKHRSWLRRVRTEAEHADRELVRKTVLFHKARKEQASTEASRLAEDVARRGRRAERRQREKQKYDELVSSGVTIDVQDSLFEDSTMSQVDGQRTANLQKRAERMERYAAQQPEPGKQAGLLDTVSEGGLYDSTPADDGSPAPIGDTPTSPASRASQDSLLAFADAFLSTSEAAALDALPPPTLQRSVFDASTLAVPPQDSHAAGGPRTQLRPSKVVQGAAAGILQQGSLEWATDKARGEVANLYESARHAFVKNGKSGMKYENGIQDHMKGQS